MTSKCTPQEMTFDQRLAIAEANITNHLSHEHARMYHISLARRLGSINTAVFLADLAAYRNFFQRVEILRSHIKYGEGWVPYSLDKCEERTALSRKEQDTSIAVLIKLNLIEKVVFGVPGERHFRLKTFECEAFLFSNNVSRMTETDKVECPKRSFYNDRNGQTPRACSVSSYEMSYEMLREGENAPTPNISSGIRKTGEKKASPKVSYSKYASMTEEEYKSLVTEFGEDFVKLKIAKLDTQCAEQKSPYKDSYLKLRAWCLEDKLKSAPKSPIQEKIEKKVDTTTKNRAYLKEMLRINQHIEKHCTQWEMSITLRKNPGSKLKDTILFSEVSFRQMFESWLKKNEISFIGIENE